GQWRARADALRRRGDLDPCPSVSCLLCGRRAGMGVPRAQGDARADLRGHAGAGRRGARRGGPDARPAVERRREMIRAPWGVARNDLAVWLRSPAAIAAALLPALGMGVLVAMLTASVGQQPVALVVQGEGRFAHRMARMIKADKDAYQLEEMSAA